MVKKKKEITTTQPIPANEEIGGEFWCFLEMKMKPMPPQMIDKIAENIIKWIDNADSSKGEGLRINQFISSYSPKIDDSDYYAWVEKYPSLKKAHLYALAKIADRRETGAMLGSLNPNVIMRYQPMYDKGVVKMMEWQAKLAKQEEQAKMNLTVLLGKSEETDVVPPKKVKE